MGKGGKTKDSHTHWVQRVNERLSEKARIV